MYKNNEYEVEIIRLNNEGQGICLVDGIVTFVDGVLIGELVKIKIIEKKKNYLVGELIEIIKSSNERRVPICPFFYSCGGCNIMHMDYTKQLDFKLDKIKSVFKKICNEDINIENINSYNVLNYRNKVVFKVENDKVGFYTKKSNSLIDINECIIADQRINDLLMIFRKFIKEYPDNNISFLLIRVCNEESMIGIDNINDDIKDKFIEIFNTVSSIYINNKNVFGVPSLNQKLNNLVFDVSLKSFFQVNPLVAENLYNYVLSFVDKSDTTIDLYSGTGTITMLLAKKSRKVIGVEVVKEAVNDAKNNLLLNGIDNVEFMHGKVENLIDKLTSLNVDTLVMDPPRGGSDRKSLKSIMEIGPNKIIYISCNPVTLARDYNILKENYKITNMSAFDMFPNTYHCESVVILERK